MLCLGEGAGLRLRKRGASRRPDAAARAPDAHEENTPGGFLESASEFKASAFGVVQGTCKHALTLSGYVFISCGTPCSGSTRVGCGSMWRASSAQAARRQRARSGQQRVRGLGRWSVATSRARAARGSISVPTPVGPRQTHARDRRCRYDKYRRHCHWPCYRVKECLDLDVATSISDTFARWALLLCSVSVW